MSMTPRSHLGLLSSIPPELIDMIFRYLSVPQHAARLGAAHPILSRQAFSRVVQLRFQAMNRITWSRHRIVLVGDYLYQPQDHEGLLPDALRADMNVPTVRTVTSPNSSDTDDGPTLYQFASRHFKGVNYNSVGPWNVLERREERVRRKEYENLSWEEQRAERRLHHVDSERIDKILSHAQPTLPSSKTAVLCNLTKRQFVRAEKLRQVRVGDARDSDEAVESDGSDLSEYSQPYPRHLTIGTTILFMTLCTDDWGFIPSRRRGPEGDGDREELRTVVGRWAGDCLEVVGPEDVEEHMTDISESVVEMLDKFDCSATPISFRLPILALKPV
ncbi:hypothetical protein PENSPDRAFT_659375 [Peniophora sp. CONT]|nr:hypothetical protein PENSPDRAFT_659375 [Peniophora sp. CONT]